MLPGLDITRRLSALEDRLRKLERRQQSTGAGGNATIDASYVTINPEVLLNHERTLNAGVLMDLTDGGSNNPVTLDVQLSNIARITASDTFEYVTTGAGLTAALAACGAGDILLLPPATYAGNQQIPAGVEVVGWGRRSAVIIDGQVDFQNAVILRNLTVQHTANSGADLIGLVPLAATGWAYDCVVTVTQSGAGRAFGTYQSDGGLFVLWGCDLRAVSVGGAGYAAGLSEGILELYHSKAYGSMDRFLKE